MALTKSVEEIVEEDTSGLLAAHLSWQRVHLREVAQVVNGFPFDSAGFNLEHGVPLARIRDVLAGRTSTYFDGAFDRGYLLADGDLLVGMDGDFHAARWKGGPALLNQRVCKIAVDSSLYEPRLIDVLLPVYLAAINAETSSVTVKHLSSRTIEDIWLPLPPRGEQRRLADKLDELLGDLDAAVVDLIAARRKLAVYRQSLLKSAVEGSLTYEWRQRNRTEEAGKDLHVRLLRERRARWEARQLARFKAQGKSAPKDWRDRFEPGTTPDTSNLLSLPEGWVYTSIGQCFEVAVGATPSRKAAEYWGGGVPWVSSGEVSFNRIAATRETISDAGLANSSTQINPVGSVLLGMIGEGKTRGQVAILDIPAANNQNCAAIWVSETNVPPEFVYFWLWSRYDETRRGSSGNNQPALNKSLVQAMPVPLAPIEEMREIAERVGVQFAGIEAQEREIDRLLRVAAAQRQNILRAAFSGQLVPQDPNDEPASVLLERIRAQRQAAAPATKRKPGRPAKATA